VKCVRKGCKRKAKLSSLLCRIHHTLVVARAMAAAKKERQPWPRRRCPRCDESIAEREMWRHVGRKLCEKTRQEKERAATEVVER
jgi:hypothetical protein